MAVRELFTDRRGGVSAPPLEELNLAAHVGDDPDAVRANRALVASAVEVPPDRLVVLAAGSGGPVGVVDADSPGEVSGVEAIVTRTPDLAIGVVAAETRAVAPAAGSTTSWGTTALDLPRAVRAQLDECGVEHANVFSDGRCTREDPTLYSYRRDGRTGRQASVIVRSDDG